jgi:hypothetical protein
MNATGEHIAMLNQKKLAVAVTVALGASLGAMSVAQATSSLFFPQVVGSQTVASIVTVMNTASGRVGQFTNGNLHLTLWSKQLTDPATDNLKVCDEINEYRTTSFNDIATFDLFGEFGQATNGMLFENNVPTRNVDWRGDATWSIGDFLNLPRRGFLLVSNEDNSSITGQGKLKGEIFIFEFAAGATWGYQAAERNEGALPTFDYSGAQSAAGQAVAIMPYEEIDTALMVTPVNGAGFTQNRGDIPAAIALTQTWVDGKNVLGLFDRDENPISRNNGASVVCVGRVDVDGILWGTNAIPTRYLDGGWANVVIQGGVYKDYDAAGTLQTVTAAGASVFKLEYNITDTFNGEAVTGTFNNATHLMPTSGWNK